MPFQSRVYRILIASPGDVSAERDAVVGAIHDWNYLNAAERNITLLPLRWETHTTPQLGDRPQALINRQIGDKCDALIGIFWTRFGSPTGVADSGTLEEIEEAVNAGKPAMLYFSTAPQNPDLIETDQLVRLREFREKIKNKGLIQPYGSLAEFRDLLARHIENQVRNLASVELGAGADLPNRPNTADIRIIFDDKMKLSDVTENGTRAKVATTILRIADPENISDFLPPAVHKNISPNSFLGSNTNTDYYRDVAGYVRDSVAFKDIVFAITNVGVIGARDVYLDIHFSADKPITLATAKDLKLQMPSETTGWPYTPAKANHEVSIGWTTNREVGAAQPQRTIHWDADVFLGVWESCTVDINIKVYADIFAAPVSRSLKLDWTVTHTNVSADEFVKTLRKDGKAA